MRIPLVTVALLIAAMPATAADPKPPDWLPRYDFAIDLDVHCEKAEVVQQATWTNRSDKPVSELIFNVHSHFTPPQTREKVLLFARLLEIFRLPFREAVYYTTAFNLNKVELLRKVGNDWKADELKYQWNKDLETALMVGLPEPVPPGGSVTVSLSYTMKLPQKQGRWGQWKGVTFLSNWHPVLAFHDPEKGWLPTPFVPWHQPWFNDAGVYNAKVRLPKNEQVASTGSITEVKADGDNKVVSIGPVVSRDFALLTSSRYKEFSVEAQNSNGKKVKVKCLAFPEHEFYANVLLKHTARAIEHFSKSIGPYPYPEHTIAESYFGWNGNECAGLVMIDERVFTMPHLAENYVQYLVSHETCHQWFYNVIGTDGFRETFMDESIVTYLTHRLLNQLEGKNNDLLNFPPELSFLPGIKRENYRYSQFYSFLKNNALQPAVQDMQKYGNVISLFAAVYDRGSKIVGIIEDRLGPVAFDDFMRRLYTKYHFRTLRVADFQKELEEFTGRKWGDFFKTWLTTAGVSDWAVDEVDVANTPKEAKAGYTATVILSQRAQISEETTLGFSFDGGTSYAVRVPVKFPEKDAPAKDVPGQPKFERIDDTHVRVSVELPSQPDQISVDPDQVLPDADPSNNWWKRPVNIRPRALYTFLDETAYTNDYDRWNLIYGPWAYGAAYNDGWFTRSSVLGVRGGAYRLEEFRGGVYAGFRPMFGDAAIGADGLLSHEPWPKAELGFNVEKSVAPFMAQRNYRPDRAVGWLRHNMEATSSLYWIPREFVDTYVAYQRNWMPTPRHRHRMGEEIDPLTTVGVRYYHETMVPYWDAEDGYRLDVNAALGMPLFGEDEWSGMVWGQYSYVLAPPEGLGWFSDVKLALRAFGGAGFPKNARLFALGGGQMFRGFDTAERQGSCLWIGSVEVRLPIHRDLDLDFLDHMVRLKNVYVAPFYDIGDIYLNGRSLGPVAHAVGLGLRFDVAFFSFLERATLRFDIAQPLKSTTNSTQFWFGLQQPF